MTLTAERLRELLTYEPDTGRFYWKDRPRSDFRSSQGYSAWRRNTLDREAGADSGHGYRRISINNRHFLAHRLAWLYVHGEWPSQHIDHINGDGGDNRIANLRDVSNAENHRNCKLIVTNKSGVSGVRLSRWNTWQAAIWNDGKIIRLGSFKTKQEAIAAREVAERELGYHPNHGKRTEHTVGYAISK